MKTKLGRRRLLIGLLTAALSIVGGDFDSGLGIAPARAAEPGAAEALKKPMALTFDRNTFEESLNIVSEEIGVPIEFVSADMLTDGITKHKSFGLDEKEQPAGQLIRTIFKKADPDGRLVYYYKPKTSGGPEVIFVATRAGAEARKEKLPPEFAQASSTGKPAAKTPLKPKKK